MADELLKFEHNGFSCTVIERPDLYYTKQVFGIRGDERWLPRIKFDKELSLEQVQKAACEMLDGTFSGQIEVYNGIHIWEGESAEMVNG